MKCTTLSSSRGPQQTKPASFLKSLNQTTGLIFKVKNPDINQTCICCWKRVMKEQLAFLLIIG